MPPWDSIYGCTGWLLPKITLIIQLVHNSLSETFLIIIADRFGKTPNIDHS